MNEYPLVSVVIPTHNRKEKLIRLINSVLKSNYPKDKLEIIVVDDASTDGTYEEVKRKFLEVKIVRNEKELFLAGSRNIGIKNSTGDYILFIDDDNVIDKNTIIHLIKIMNAYSDIGVCAPVMLYYKTNIVWCAGVRRNMITSKTTYLFNGKDLQEIRSLKIIESDDFPNCFMVRSEILKKYNLSLDEKNFPIHYDEADFCYKIKKLGYKVVCYTKAKVWHDVKRSEVTRFETWRAYYSARNRIIFHKKYSKWWQFLIFISVFNWLFMVYYLKAIFFNSPKTFRERLSIAVNYLKGLKDGFQKK